MWSSSCFAVGRLVAVGKKSNWQKIRFGDCEDSHEVFCITKEMPDPRCTFWNCHEMPFYEHHIGELFWEDCSKALFMQC